MKKCKKMTQCKLERKDIIEISWIPDEFAKKDNYLEIDGVNGWKVLEVWTTMGSDKVIGNERDFKKTRPASDIPRGKIKRIFKENGEICE